MESTFSHSSKLDFIDMAKTAGFSTVVNHVNLASADLAVSRVSDRVNAGGHPVDEAKIRARYERSQPLIQRAVTGADVGLVFDNSGHGQGHAPLISMRSGAVEFLGNKFEPHTLSMPDWARRLYEKELSGFSEHQLNPKGHDFALMEKLVTQLAGQQVSLLNDRAARDESSGLTVGSNPNYLLQKTVEKDSEAQHFIIHDKKHLNQAVREGEAVRIRYTDAGRGSVTQLSQVAELGNNPRGLDR